MVDVVLVLMAASLILFFGFFAEFVFKRFNIPDVLFLIILGFVIGPNVLKYVLPADIFGIAPVFTTFTLLFLLFDGGFNINLTSLIREFSHSFTLTLFNFVISSAIIGVVVYLTGLFFFDGFSIALSLLTGFLLGGVSSSFVIPILKEIKVSEKIYSLLTLESALTDVFCIVGALTVMTFLNAGQFGVQSTFSQIVTLFAVAGLVGLVAGIVWIVLVIKVFKEHNYMMLIAYLLLVYVVTELLNGNGAIATLFFGIMLKNSKELSSIIRGILTKKAREKKKALKGELGVSVTTPSEEFFYHQISFFLKTFFFVYIGILIDLSDWKALILGIILSFVLMFSRLGSLVLTKKMEPLQRSLINSMFARGLAAAAIAQMAVIQGIPHADFIARVTYIVITGTIILSSIKIFIIKLKMSKVEEVVLSKKGKKSRV
ncbi:MAG: cation:proton antiporter [Candidatus Woesearchaeota archaeon]